MSQSLRLFSRLVWWWFGRREPPPGDVVQSEKGLYPMGTKRIFSEEYNDASLPEPSPRPTKAPSPANESTSTSWTDSRMDDDDASHDPSSFDI